MSKTVEFDVPMSVTAGAASDVSFLTGLAVVASGTFDATLQLEGSLDGVIWLDEGAPISSPSTTPVAVAPTYAAMRVNVTAFTSGTPAVTLRGHNTP